MSTLQCTRTAADFCVVGDDVMIETPAAQTVDARHLPRWLPSLAPAVRCARGFATSMCVQVLVAVSPLVESTSQPSLAYPPVFRFIYFFGRLQRKEVQLSQGRLHRRGLPGHQEVSVLYQVCHLQPVSSQIV